MADLKISQLTGATTPLAGTEVLPIVQSSTTKKVAVSDLTVGRAVAAASLETTGKIGVSVTAASGIGQLSNTNTAWAGGNATDGFVWRSVQNDWTAAILGTPASGAGYALRLHTLGTTTSDYPLWVSSGAGSGTVKFSIKGDGTTTFTGGNIVQGTAAKGVNFTANTAASGMTSQLLNWYEEGTWTPAISSSSGTITTVSSISGYYTRVGRQVTLTGKFTITTNGTGAGVILIQSLPWNVANALGAGTGNDGGLSNPAMKTIFAGATNYLIMQNCTDGSYPVATGSVISFAFTYFA